MTIQEAIKKAIERGFKEGALTHYLYSVDEFGFHTMKNRDTRVPVDTTSPDTIFLDPSFWRSLGKALGSDWRATWHRCIDHLAEGKMAEAFFEGL